MAQNQGMTHMFYWSILHCSLTELIHRMPQDLGCLFLEVRLRQTSIT